MKLSNVSDSIGYVRYITIEMRFSEGTIYYTAFVIDWTNVLKWEIGHDGQVCIMFQIMVAANTQGVSILKNLDDLNNVTKKRPQ